MSLRSATLQGSFHAVGWADFSRISLQLEMQASQLRTVSVSPHKHMARRRTFHGGESCFKCKHRSLFECLKSKTLAPPNAERTRAPGTCGHCGWVQNGGDHRGGLFGSFLQNRASSVLPSSERALRCLPKGAGNSRPHKSLPTVGTAAYSQSPKSDTTERACGR